jgi:hypothetical protein
MSSRVKRIQRQQDSETKMKQALQEGKATRVQYEERKKKPALPNRLNMAESTEAEIKEKQSVAEDATKVYRKMLPSLLENLSRIKDPRKLGSVKHKHTVLLLYGILMFVQQVGSRREANRSMERIQFENLRAMFPELETMPHADTLARFLEVIEVGEIQNCMTDLLKELIRKKKFNKYLVKNNYLVAIDGTQKLYRDYQWDDNALVRHVGTEKVAQYYVYVLESVLVLGNGITLPLLSEFLKNENYLEGVNKQDCERVAFARLAKRIKGLFPKLKITLLADGLYACGPVIRRCRKYGWEFMITLKEGSMPDVFHEAMGLVRISPEEDKKRVQWGDRIQNYGWANDMEYEYGEKKRHREIIHVVFCYESWEENHSRSTEVVEMKETRYCWISSTPFTRKNVFERCTKMGRYRWKIENNILTEKHQGYDYGHCYSYTWNAMEGYHYLMKIGRFLNVIAANSELLFVRIKELGIRGLIHYLRSAISCHLLNREAMQKVVEGVYQLRLVE